MSRPSSRPSCEHAPKPGVTWMTSTVWTETVIDDDAPDPKPNRATRRAIARARRKR